MSNQQQPAIITLADANGQTTSFQILDVFDFEGQKYALLLTMDGQDADSLLIMKLIQRDHEPIFQMIENEDEFNRVVAFVEKSAR